MPASTPAQLDPGSAAPPAYTPRHLAAEVLTSRSIRDGERKQVTVLFCDLVDATALAERLGPEAMHELLSRFFELALGEVHRYGGTINQFLGDGFLALFGAPLAHEDHARRAVLAALAVRRRLNERSAAPDPDRTGELAVRMGLNTGLVVVGAIGANLRFDYTAVGDTTNVAARLQALAAPGTILVGEATARLATGYVRVEPIGSLQVKGKSDPVAAYKVLEVGPRRSPLDGVTRRALSRFVGRERQLADLRAVLAQVEAGRGQVIGIVGEPGMGKSRLLLEFRRRLARKRITYLEGRCLSYGSAVPYLPLLDVLRSNCGITAADDPATITGKVRAGLREVGIEPEEAGPYLLQLLGVKAGTDRLAGLTPEAIKAGTFETLRQLALHGSRRRPLVLVVEDLHWIDQTTEEYLASLVESLAGARILLLCTYRPGYRPAWLERSYAAQVPLPPLPPGDGLAVVRSVRRTERVPDRLARVILERAEGNPFFLEELARAAGEDGGLRSDGAVPSTIQGVLMARIDRLPPEPRRVLQTAAVLGREFSLRLLAAIWDGPGVLDPLLLELKQLEFLYELAATDEPVYAFKHALTQEVAYECLLTTRRRALHEAAGRSLESLHADRLDEHVELLAYHYARSAERDKAVEYLARANQKVIAANAMETATGYFEQAMTFLDTMPDTEVNRRRRITLLAKQGLVANQLFRFREHYSCLTRYERVAVELGDPGLLHDVYRDMAWSEWSFGEFDRAIATATRATDFWQAAPDASASAYLNLAWNYVCKGEFDRALSLKAEVLRRLTGRFNLAWYAFALNAATLANTWLGRWDAAVADGLEAMRVGQESHDNRVVTDGAFLLALAYAAKGDLGRRRLARSPRSSRPSPRTTSCMLAAPWPGSGPEPRDDLMASRGSCS